jgi:hypothetical protein
MKMVSFALVIDVVGKVPASTFIVFVVCLFILVVLVLVNESACDRLIRILRVMLGKSDKTQKQKRK